VVYLGLVSLAGGSEGPLWRLLLELPRWVLEVGLGAILVAPGEIEPPDPALLRFGRPGRDDTGAASLEYAGSLFVVVLVVASLIAVATPIGAAIKAKICEAVGASCGSSAAQRAKGLSITCTMSKRDRDLGYYVAVEGVRGQRKDSDSITKYGDGSATVVVSQGAGIGVDGGSKASGVPLGYTLQGVGNGDLGLVYRFPAQYGGPAAAQDFVDGRRSGWQQATQIAVPGLQAVEDGASQGWNGVRNWWQDSVVPFFGGDGPSRQDLAARDTAQRKGTADAVQISLSLQGQAGVNAGSGVKVKTGQPAAPGQREPTKVSGGPATANAKAAIEVKGQATIGLDTGKPDSVASSFSASIKVDADASAILGGNPGDNPAGQLPFLAFKGSAGAAGQYSVSYDAAGNPVKLVVTGEYKFGGGGGVQLPGGRRIGGKTLNQDVTTHEYAMVLDLNTATSQGRANREAFDTFFLTTGFSVNGAQARMSVPLQSDSAPALVTSGLSLAARLGSDAFVIQSEYADSKDENGVDGKVAGWGLGGSMNSTTRSLISATGYDLRNGGLPATLANCEGK
jgi:Flp pilus assembly pilin Flp